MSKRERSARLLAGRITAQVSVYMDNCSPELSDEDRAGCAFIGQTLARLAAGCLMANGHDALLATFSKVLERIDEEDARQQAEKQ